MAPHNHSGNDDVEGEEWNRSVRYNHEDDTYEIVTAALGSDQTSYLENESDNYPAEQEVVRVERILGERQERKEQNVFRFLSDL